MTGLISIYLDLLRFLASIGVFFSHAHQHSAAPGVLPNVYFDHMLVIVFFVISGYVITASAFRPDRTLANYSADRLARLSSVVVPALLVTYCLDAIGSWASPSLYSYLDPHWQGVRFVINFFYCQQIWFLCVNPSSNTPLWSLGYEFWYYFLFGIWLFVKPLRWKIPLLLVVALFIGPKILLLMPAWILGALAFHAGRVWRCSRRKSFWLFVATGVAMVVALLFEDQLGLNNGQSGHPPLYYSSNYLGDNIFALIVAVHFLCCCLYSRHLVKDFEPLKSVRFIRWLASHTFSLYVYHMPLLFFIRAVVGYNPNHLFAALAAMAGALLAVAGLSKITEERHPVLRQYLRKKFSSLSLKLRPLKVPLPPKSDAFPEPL